MATKKKNVITFSQLKKVISASQLESSLKSEELKLLKNKQIIISILAKNGHLNAYNISKKSEAEFKHELDEEKETLQNNIEDFGNKTMANKHFPKNLDDPLRKQKIKELKDMQFQKIQKEVGEISQTDTRHLLESSLLENHYVRIVGKPTPAHFGKEKTYAIATKGLILAIFYETDHSLNPIYYNEEFDNSKSSYIITEKINPHRATFRIPIQSYPHDDSLFVENYVGNLDVILKQNIDFFGIDFSKVKNQVLEIARMSLVIAAQDLTKMFSPLHFLLWEFDEEYTGISKSNIEKITSKVLEKLEKWEKVRRNQFLSLFYSEPLLRKWNGWESWLALLLEDSTRGKIVAEYLIEKENDYKSSKASIERSLEAVKEAKAYFKISETTTDG